MSFLITYDPNNKYSHLSPQYFHERFQFLASWIAHKPKEQNILECIKENYPYFHAWDSNEAKIDSLGKYSYPGDPDLWPMMLAKDNNEYTLLVYEYDIACFHNSKTGEDLMCRLD